MYLSIGFFRYCATFFDYISQTEYNTNERQFGLKCAGDRDAFDAFSEVLSTIRMHSFFSLFSTGNERF